MVEKANVDKHIQARKQKNQKLQPSKEVDQRFSSTRETVTATRERENSNGKGHSKPEREPYHGDEVHDTSTKKRRLYLHHSGEGVTLDKSLISKILSNQNKK